MSSTLIGNGSLSQLCINLRVQGIRAGEGSSVKENCSLVKTEATVKNRKRLESTGSKTG